MAIRQQGNNTLVGLETELPLTGSSGSFFMAENTSNLYGYYSAGTPTLISGTTRSLQQVIDVNQTADKVQFIASGITGNLSNGVIGDAILLQNNNFMIYGSFSGYNGTIKNRICEIDMSGNIVTSFSGSIDNGTYFVPTNMVESVDGIYVGGSFSLVNGTSINKLVRFKQDGSIDTAFNIGSGFNGSNISQINIDANGKILATGSFTTFSGVTTNSRIVRLNTDGTRDYTLNITGATNNVVSTNTIDSLGRIYVTYYGSTFNDRNQSGLMRLFNDGSIDGSFNVGTGPFPINAAINRVAIDSVGRIYLFGDLTSYNGVTVNNIVRLNDNGSIDTTFNTGTGFNSRVQNITFFNDNSFLAYGLFTLYNGVSVNRIIKLNIDGSVDTTFKYDSDFTRNCNQYKDIIVGDKIYLFGSGLLNYSGGSTNVTSIRFDGSLSTSNLVYSGGIMTYNIDNITNAYEYEILNKKVTREFIETYDISSPSNTINVDSSIPTNTKIEVSNTILSDISSRELTSNKVNILTGTSANYPSVIALNNTRIGSFGITIDGSTASPTNGVKGYVTIPYDCVITGWDIIGNTTGNCVIDVWRSSVIPTPSDSITGTEKPTLTTQQMGRDDNLTTWNTVVNKNDIITFNLESSSIVTRITLIIKVLKK